MTCRQDRPRSEFSGSPYAKRCDECKRKADLRPCYWCLVPKSRNEFGRTRAGRSTAVCLDCRRREAEEKAARVAARRSTWLDERTGRWIRRCCRCRIGRDLEDDFYEEYPQADTLARRRGYICKACQVERITARRRAALDDPVTGPQLRAERARIQREYRRRHPEKDRTWSSTYWRRLKASPQRYRQHLENRRVGYAIKVYEQGRQLRPMRVVEPSLVQRGGRDLRGMLPGLPLAAEVDRLAREADSERVVIDRAGVDGCAIRRWRAGGGVGVSIAEDVVDRLFLEWWNLWPDAGVDLGEVDAGAEASLARAWFDGSYGSARSDGVLDELERRAEAVEAQRAHELAERVFDRTATVR